MLNEKAPPRAKPLGRREINKQATRAAILRAARKLFGRYGYSDTPLESIVRAARVTTGAVYDHFGDKKALFQAVAEGTEVEILERLAIATLDAPDTWAKLISGTIAILEICSEPEIRQIVFLDAPNVIGVAEWHEIQLRYGYGAMHQTLHELSATGQIRAAPIEMLAPMLLGALITAASRVALAPDRTAALHDARQTALILIKSLRTP